MPVPFNEDRCHLRQSPALGDGRSKTYQVLIDGLETYVIPLL